jgi:hypothetical protein
MDEFGGPATYMPAAGGSFPISGVFDEAYRDLEMVDEGEGVNTVVPVFGVRLSAFPSAPVQGDKVSILSVNETYIVNDVRPDGHGHAKLMLNFVSAP